jgi:WD40 repeat protein
VRAYFANEQATVAFAPDFQSYLTATGTGDFALLAAADGAIVRRFQPAGGGQPLGFGFSGDGQRLLVRFTDGRIEFWSREGAEPLGALSPSGPRGAAAALHPREPVAAWAAADGSIRVRSLEGGNERLLADAGPDVRRLGYAPDGATLAVVRADRVELRDAATGALRWRRDGAFAAVDPAWSAAAGWLAVADESRGDLLVLATDTGRVVQEMPGGGAVPVLLAWAPGAHRLAAIASDAMLRVWEMRSGEVVFQTGMPPRVLAFSPDGRHLAGARRWLEVGVWAWAGETVFREWRGAEVTRRRADEIALSPDGRWLASSESGTGAALGCGAR